MTSNNNKLCSGAQANLCWSIVLHVVAGVGPTPFTLSLPFAKTKVGRIAVDPYMHVLAPPRQEEAAGHVRGEGEAVAVKGQVSRCSL